MEEIVNFEDWEKLEFRVAQVKQVEEIEGADKLWKLTLDVGEEIGERIVCAGIKKHYSKEELEGKKLIVFVNLAPRKMRGVESQGMILAAVSEEDSAHPPTQKDEAPKEKVVFLSPEKDIEVGSRVR
jgi:methionine--tRNA ligase beta chain